MAILFLAGPIRYDKLEEMILANQRDQHERTVPGHVSSAKPVVIARTTLADFVESTNLLAITHRNTPSTRKYGSVSTWVRIAWCAIVRDARPVINTVRATAERSISEESILECSAKIWWNCLEARTNVGHWVATVWSKRDGFVECSFPAMASHQFSRKNSLWLPLMHPYLLSEAHERWTRTEEQEGRICSCSISSMCRCMRLIWLGLSINMHSSLIITNSCIMVSNSISTGLIICIEDNAFIHQEFPFVLEGDET
jgi:hypothetical protein